MQHREGETLLQLPFWWRVERYRENPRVHSWTSISVTEEIMPYCKLHNKAYVGLLYQRY